MQSTRGGRTKVLPTIEEVLEARAADQARSIVAMLRFLERNADNGELIIRKDDLIGRIHVVDGAIAWIHTDGHGGYLTDLLLERVEIPRDELSRLLMRCRRDGTPLGEALIAAGAIARAQFEEILLEHTRRQLLVTLEYPRPGAMVFLPARQRLSVQRVFTVDEVVGEALRSTEDGTKLEERLSAAADRLAAGLVGVDGIIGCGVVSAASIEPACQLRVVGTPTDEESVAMEQWAGRLALSAAAAADGAGFVADESLHLTGAHQVYEHRAGGTVDFVIARATISLGAFLARVRMALDGEGPTSNGAGVATSAYS